MSGDTSPVRAGAILVACSLCASALNPSLDISQYAHTSWKISEAFGKGAIWVIDQTADGYLWLATESGLRRFDGVRSVEWKPPAGEHLPNRNIRNLLAARDGTLWIGTGKGLVSWKAAKLTKYPAFDKHDIAALLQDREGVVWVAAKIWEAGHSQPGKLCSIDNGRVQCVGSDGRFGDYGVTAMYQDSRGNLWLGAGNGIWRWKPGPPQHYPVSAMFRKGVVGLLFPKRAFLEESDGALLVTGPRGIWRFKDGQVSPYPLPPGAPQLRYGKLLRDRNGGLWIGTWDAGLAHLHEGRMDVFAQPDGLSSNSIENLFEDREGTIWIAGGNGLESFHDYAVSTLSSKQGLSSPSVTSVLATGDGSVWIGTTDGLNRWKDGQLTVYRKRTAGGKSQQKLGAAVRELNASGLPDNTIGSLYREPQGRMWITGRGLAWFEDGRFVPFPVLNAPLWFMGPVARDSAGTLWMTSDRGLHRLSPARVFEDIPSARLGLQGNLASLLAADPVDGGLWVGSWQGGVVHFKDGQVRASYGPADGLGDGRVSALQLDSENTLWAATDGGLSRIKNGRVATLTTKNGLPCDAAHGIAQDDEGSLWIYMACGLARIRRPELDAWIADPNRRIPVTVLDALDGVESHADVQSWFAPRMTKAADGKVWFVPTGGVSFFDPHHLAFNNLPPQVHIEQITADNRKYDVARRMRLPPRVRNVAIDFTALSLIVPERVRFRFKLEGQDPDWREAVNQRRVEYSNLPPRSYLFRVMACNNSGVWNETGDSLEFSVDSAYYQTPLFRAACVAAFLAMVWGLYRFRLHQIAERFNAHLEGRVEERTRVARELHDTLLQSFQGSLLVMQSARNFLSRRPEQAGETLDAAIRMAEGAITEGRAAIGELRFAPAIQSDLAQLLTETGQELAHSQDATGSPVIFEVTIDGERRGLDPILQDEVYRIGREVLRNAFRHAHASRIEVEILYDGRLLRVRIRDDGKGIDHQVMEAGAREGHWGLPGMRERAKQIGAQLVLWSELGEGTEVELTVPARIAYAKFRVRRRFGLFRKMSEAR